MNMKKIIYTLFVFGLFSCTNDHTNRTEENGNETSKVSSVLVDNDRQNKRGKEYVNQLPYVDSNHDFLNFSMENQLNEKMNDPNITWEEIDKLYHDDLNPAQKQFLIYIILAKKDLIGLQNENPTDAQYAKLAKYTQELVDSKYIGYCLLYHALATLHHGDNAEQIKSYANEIEHYSANESFHSNFLANPNGKGEYIQKIRENQSFLDKIKEL